MPVVTEATDSSADKPTALSLVKEALQTYMLPQLETCQLLDLRHTCTAWRDVIDSAPIGPLLAAASQIIPEEVLCQITSSVDLLDAANQQAKILYKLHCSSSSLQQLPKLFSHVQECSGWCQWAHSVGHRWVATSSWRPAASTTGSGLNLCSGPWNMRKMTHPWHQVIEPLL